VCLCKRYRLQEDTDSDTQEFDTIGIKLLKPREMGVTHAEISCLKSNFRKGHCYVNNGRMGFYR
jgi:hypothetical protein